MHGAILHSMSQDHLHCILISILSPGG